MGRLLEQQKKLDADEESANEDLKAIHAKMLEMQSQLSAAVARLSRIRKIRNRVKERSSELFRQGMEELDKEDGLLPTLNAHEQHVVSDIQSLGVPDEVN
ncbi:hypothetical protein ACRE_090000 [Hapsidospora chrysogenum ATCC 11550]|uniref:Uncharacterized protein n=1 Tax=Hapsidospora chrysogenum (strain ATCC 11550 / CBS 779.69 / DSM 880 / IAM 14645 / JCM 23072 / IMI 49137) TaxID=857340 RepID=A0A086STA6_HAPC1|nr:hypothetical protein ACRE_090000 [Hapsidospora chrysogenum ATCC 11550]